MNSKFVVVTTIGFMCIAFVTFTSNLNAAGWTREFGGYSSIMFLTLGTALLGVMAFLAFFYGRPLDAIIFFGSTGFYWTLHAGFHAKISAASDAWFLLLWSVFFFYVWLASFKAGWTRSLFLMVTWLGILVCVFPDWTSSEIFRYVRGYLGLLAGLIALYISAAEVISFSRHHGINGQDNEFGSGAT